MFLSFRCSFSKKGQKHTNHQIAFALDLIKNGIFRVIFCVAFDKNKYLIMTVLVIFVYNVIQYGPYTNFNIN